MYMQSGAVAVGAGGRDRAADEGGVVRRVLGVQDHHQIEQVRLLGRVELVLAQHAQVVLRQTQPRLGIVHVERLVVVVVPLGAEGIRRDEREARDQLDRLARVRMIQAPSAGG